MPAGRRRRWLFWLAVALPGAALLIAGVRLIEQETELEAKRREDGRADTAADVSRALTEQLRGIVVAEGVAERGPRYVEGATALVARLTRRGLALPWRDAAGQATGGGDEWILRGRAVSPATCRAVVEAAAAPPAPAIRSRCDDLDRAERLAGDVATLAAVRGAFGEARAVAWDQGRWLLAMSYVDAGDPLLVAVRVPDLVRAAGIPLGDSMAVVGRPQADARPLAAGLDGLWLAWTTASVETSWSGTRQYLATTLALTLVVAALAAYLLDRDVRRTMHVTQMREQFVAGVSHELKTPLTAIRMYADTLRDGRVAGPAAAEYLDTIIVESERLSRLVDNVLDFSRIEHGKRMYRFAEGDLVAVVRHAIATLRRPIEQQGFRLQLTLPEQLPMPRLDADAIEQAVLNLVGNAMKYSADAREIEVTVATIGAEAVVRVRDHGIGVPAAERERIFERFHRAPGTTLETTGTGLGLTLVQHAVTAHGGRVTVEPAPGRGSVFSLYLPLAAAT